MKKVKLMLFAYLKPFWSSRNFILGESLLLDPDPAACRRKLGTKFEAMNLLKEFSRETKEKPDYLVHGSDEACSEDGEHQAGNLEEV